jgi:hypothetical protein
MNCDYGCNQEANYKLGNKYCCSEHRNKCPELRRKNSKSCKGKIISEDQKQKLSIAAGKDENCHRWKGGSDMYFHKKAWELFGKYKCEICGITLLEYKKKFNQRFDMHCNSLPKDYTILEEYNWMTLCSKCHKNLEINLQTE